MRGGRGGALREVALLCHSFYPIIVQTAARINDQGPSRVKRWNTLALAQLRGSRVSAVLPGSAVSFYNPLKTAAHKCQDTS